MQNTETHGTESGDTGMSTRRRALLAACCAALIAALPALAGCRGGQNTEADGRTELLVSAAASLQSSLDRIAAAFERAHPGIRVTMNYGASGALRRQIEQGAPADLFISADIAQMDRLAAAGLIGKHAVLLGNRLAVVVPADRGGKLPGSPDDLAAAEYRVIAIGDPDTSPAGAYAAEALEHAGLLARLEPKFVFGKDVRQVLAYVESGNADAGFVYGTDATQSSAVREAFAVPDEWYSPVRYPAGIVKETKHPEEAERFFAFLTGGEARSIFEEHGFAFLYEPEA